MRILFATDGSENATAALEELLRVPLPPECEVIVLHVVEADELDDLSASGEPAETETVDAIRGELLGQAQAIVKREAERLRQHGWRTETLLRTGDAAGQILDAAEANATDLVALGAKGQGDASHVLLGSVAKKVLDHAPGSVFVGRPRRELNETTETPGRYRILLAFDGSAPARFAITLLSQWPLGERVDLTVMTVLTVATSLFRLDLGERLSQSWQTRRRRLEAELKEAVESLRTATPSVAARLLDGGERASDELLGATRLLNCDLAVVGHVGTGTLRRLLVGSVAWDVCQYAPCSVLVARK